MPIKQSFLKRLKQVAQQVLESEKADPLVELSISFVSKELVKELNAQYRKINEPTDVLAFALGEADEEVTSGGTGLPLMLGDVIISPAVALEQSKTYQTAFEEEIMLLLVHGILHLLGHDHEQPGETRVMRSKEKRLMEQFLTKAPK